MYMYLVIFHTRKLNDLVLQSMEVFKHLLMTRRSSIDKNNKHGGQFHSSELATFYNRKVLIFLLILLEPYVVGCQGTSNENPHRSR